MAWLRTEPWLWQTNMVKVGEWPSNYPTNTYPMGIPDWNENTIFLHCIASSVKDPRRHFPNISSSSSLEILRYPQSIYDKLSSRQHVLDLSWGLFTVGRVWNIYIYIYTVRHPNQMSKSPEVTDLNVMEQQLYLELLLDIQAPHPAPTCSHCQRKILAVASIDKFWSLP